MRKKVKKRDRIVALLRTGEPNLSAIARETSSSREYVRQLSVRFLGHGSRFTPKRSGEAKRFRGRFPEMVRKWLREAGYRWCSMHHGWVCEDLFYGEARQSRCGRCTALVVGARYHTNYPEASFSTKMRKNYTVEELKEFMATGKVPAVRS